MDAAQRPCRQEAAKLTSFARRMHGPVSSYILVQLASFFVLAWLTAHVISACLCVFRDEIAYEAVHVHDQSQTEIVRRTLDGRIRRA
jgi:hypothetical protein